MSPVVQLVGGIAVFLGLVLGLGLPLVAARSITAAEKIVAGAALGMVLLYLFALAYYWLGWPAATCGLAPLTALGLLSARWRQCRAAVRDPEALRLLGAWLLAAGWALGFLALVRSYSGGAWTLDWVNHFQRSLLFLQHWPANHPLSGSDFLPTRPPLANAVTAVLLGLTGATFAHFQIFTTLANSLALLPAWLLAGRFSPRPARAQAVLTVLFMLNPSVLENSTFAWTKLGPVFFVLTAVHFFLPALARGSRRRLAAVFLFLAAGLLAHYSAGPYAVVVVAAYVWARRAEWARGRFWGEAAVVALPAALLLATWFGWAWRDFGAAGTVLTNAAVTQAPVQSLSVFARDRLLGLFQTLVPHPLRAVDYGLIAQASRAGYLRDYFFLIYQTCLPVMLGSLNGLAVLWLLARAWRERTGGPAPARGFWVWFVVGAIGIAALVSGGTDPWGRAHLCLQSLVSLGLAFLAARLPAAPRGLRAGVILGAGVDLALGIGLQFRLEHLAFAPAAVLRDGGYQLVSTYGGAAFANLAAKWFYRFEFVGDWAIPLPALLGLLACLLGLAVYRCFRQDSAAPPPGAAATP